MTIYLDPLLLAASSNLPEFRLEKATQALRKVRNSAWSCTGWGLPCRSCHQKRGELLPRLFTLAEAPRREPRRLFSVTLVYRYR